MTPSPPMLYGLVLAGGLSRRMREDKATLLYQGQTFAELAYHHLQPFCRQVFLSIRPTRTIREGHGHLPQIHDRFDGIGPIGGILSAMLTYPGVAWLVLACDMPRVTSDTLAYLVAHRNTRQHVTIYRSPKVPQTEPLCAIYEPPCGPILETFVAQQQYSLRRALASMTLDLLESPEPGELESINTPEAYRQLLSAPDSPAPSP